MRLVTPLRFVSGVIALWTTGRVAVLMPDLLTPPAGADIPHEILRASTPFPSSPIALATPPSIGGDGLPMAAPGRLADAAATPRPTRVAMIQRPAAQRLLLSPAGIATPQPDAPRETPEPEAPAHAIHAPPPSPGGNLAAGPATAAAPRGSRWSGGAYLFRRGEAGGAALATGGQLGGSQAGARVAWRIDPADRFAAVARLATPLDETRGAEAAVGADWHPLPGRPLRVSVERRIDIGGSGRDAWSAYAAGGFWRPVGRGVVVDGYGQAGVVGARRRDLFADGAIRAGYRRELGGNRSLTAGGGVWGAAQPGVARLDVGPRVALGLPLAGTNVTVAAEWRMRVAGEATPRSGLAITLAADF